MVIGKLSVLYLNQQAFSSYFLPLSCWGGGAYGCSGRSTHHTSIANCLDDNDVLQPLLVCRNSAELNICWEILQHYVMLVSWIQTQSHDKDDSWKTLSLPPSQPPVVVGQLPGLLRKALCSACKGIALESHSHRSVDFQVHICKPPYLHVFAMAGLALHCFSHDESRGSESIKKPELVLRG